MLIVLQLEKFTLFLRISLYSSNLFESVYDYDISLTKRVS